MTFFRQSDFVADRKSCQTQADLARLIESIHQELLPNLRMESLNPLNPVVVHQVLEPWRLLGTGNYAGVFYHSDYRVNFCAISTVNLINLQNSIVTSN